jgi:hypothetical protein
MAENLDFVKNLLNFKKRGKDNESEENGEEPEISDEFLSKLLESNEFKQKLSENVPNMNFKSFIPEPGFVLKTKTSKDDKVFINICKSTSIVSPKDISEEELLKIMNNQNQSEIENAAFNFRIPMSLGEPHNELDNSGNGCIVYDVCINPDFYNKILNNQTFMGFFIAIAIEGLEEKYAISISRNYTMLKNKKFMGKILEQNIRIKSKPVISELTTQQESTNPKIVEQKKDTNEQPKYKIIKVSQSDVDSIDFLVAEIELPKLLSSNSIILDLGEDRILLATRSNIYYLDIYLPYNINQEDSGAEFDFKRKILTITMPIIQ